MMIQRQSENKRCEISRLIWIRKQNRADYSNLPLLSLFKKTKTTDQSLQNCKSWHRESKITIALQHWITGNLEFRLVMFLCSSLFCLRSYHEWNRFMHILNLTICLIIIIIITMITRWSWRRWLRGSQRRVQQTSSCTTKRMQVKQYFYRKLLKISRTLLR